jgi:3-deoxy-D-manno-octulosonic-acid transferase
MGELLQFYAAGDVAFVGGSYERIGGHNLLEPAALAKPVLTGPHTFNSPDITHQLLDGGAALQLNDVDELRDALLRLFAEADVRDQMGRAGLRLVRNGQGAVDRTLDIIGDLLTPAAG